MSLERVVRSLLVRVLPVRIAGEAADDLMDEARRVRRANGATAAARLLVREGAGLFVSRIVDWWLRLPRFVVAVRRDGAHAWRALARRRGSTVAAALMLAAGLASVALSSGLAAALLFTRISRWSVKRCGQRHRAW